MGRIKQFLTAALLTTITLAVYPAATAAAPVYAAPLATPAPVVETAPISPAGRAHLESPSITIPSAATQIPLDLTFTDETGKVVKLGDYFNKGKPVLLGIIYFRCAGLCSPFMNELTRTAQAMRLKSPAQYDVIIVSMDPKETPKMARDKKDNYMEQLAGKAGASGWHLLTSPDNNVRALADAVGFGYKYNPANEQFEHGTALYIVMPSGKISRTLANVMAFDSQVVDDSLVNASDGKVGSSLLFSLARTCGFITYNHATGKYENVARNIMRAGGALTVLLLAMTIGTFLYRDGRKRRRAEGGESHA